MQKVLLKKGLVFVIIALFTLTSVVPIIVGQGEEYFKADQDIPVQNGGISGDYTDTFSSDDTYEAISERESGGKPSKRYSYLEHKWTFDLTSSYTSIDFYIEAFHTANSEGDDFVFAYSTNDADYTDILTVTKTTDDNNIQGVSLSSSLSGTIYIRVKDTDQTQGRKAIDTIYIDYMCILAMSTPDTTPPVISNVASNVDVTAGIEILTNKNASWKVWKYQNDEWINTWISPELPWGAIPNAVGDVDDDGDNEVIIGHYAFNGQSGGGISVWEQSDTGGWYQFWNSSETKREIFKSVVSDADSDGINEILRCSSSEDKCAAMYKWNATSETYDEIWKGYTGTVVGYSCDIGDVNHDGIPELITSGAGAGDQAINVWEFQGGYNWLNTVNISGHGMIDNLRIADADNDGYNEIIYCSGPDNQVYVIKHIDGDYVEIWQSGDMGGSIQDCAVGDVDNDGENEIIAGACTVMKMFVWEYQGSNNWDLVWSSEEYGCINMDVITIDDLDNDGLNEFTSAEGHDGYWFIFQHVSGDQYELCYQSSEPGSISIFVGSGDVDNDAGDPIATITWTTDEPADSVVNYGTTTALGNTVSDSAFVTDHYIRLTSLTINTTYYYEVQSSDESGNTAIDDNNGEYYTFTTNIGPEISDVDSSVNSDSWFKMNPNIVGGTFNPRERHSMAYDASADRTIICGGLGDPADDLTWAYNYNDNTWTNMNPTIIGGDHSYIHDSVMVYDSQAQRIIQFGGSGLGGYYLDETWEYDYSTNTWTNLTPTMTVIGGELTGRDSHGMAYDANADRTIIFGGAAGTLESINNETWAYDYSTNTWVNRTPSMTVVGGQLRPRGMSPLVYDSQAQRIIMFGGKLNSVDRLNETWEYDYSTNTWTNLTPTMKTIGGWLEPRWWHSMVYDEHNYRTVLFSGNRGTNDHILETWIYEYDNNTWYNVSFSTVGGTLVPREASGLAYDSSNNGVVLMGGFYGPQGILDDTWVFFYGHSTTITWTTNEPSNSRINYGTTTSLGNTSSDTSFVTNHKIILANLLPDKTYYYEIQSTNQYGHTTIDDNNGNYYTFSTEQDTTPPAISYVQTSGITHNSAIITWDTDEQSNSRVNYGTTIALGDTKSDSSMVTSHSITLTNLLSETTYYYEVQSTDIDGNTEIDDNNDNYYSFTTEVAPSNEMHVDSIDMWYTQTKNKYTIYSKIKIVDAENNAVEGVIVDIDLTLPNAVVVSMSDITDSTGEVTFIYGPTPKSGTYTTTITDVVKSGWIYNSDDNVETSVSLIVP